MAKKEGKRKEIIIGTLLLIGLYFILGILINYLGMKIYFTEGIYTPMSADNYFNLDFTLANNAPLTLPFNNALFYYNAYIIEGNSSCRLGNDNECKKNFFIDFKKVPAGENRQITIKTFPNNQQNFTMYIGGRLNIFNTPLFAKSKDIFCNQIKDEYNRDVYFCKEVI